MDKSGKFPLCSVVIVNWNGMEAIKRCMESLLRHEGVGDNIEVIVSDNGSTDGSLEMLRGDFPFVKIIENGANLGFGAANNRGLASASGEFVLILNPDMEFCEKGLGRLMEHMLENPAVGLCGVMVMNPDGSFMRQCRRGYPDPLTAFFKVSGLIRLFPENERIGRYFYAGHSPEEQMDVDAISGSFMMGRREVLDEIGGFTEAFFMYVEDVDICLKARKAGYKVRYFPFMKIIHHGGACVEKRPRRRLFYHYHMTRSHIILYAADRLGGGGFEYHIAFIFIIIRYIFISVLTINWRLPLHIYEFLRIHSGRLEPAGREL